MSVGCEAMDFTPEDFERFLVWLDPDRDKAAEQYQVIEAKLNRYFQCRGWGFEAEDLCYETISRVVILMRELAESYHGERLPYFYGVARRVHMERSKKQIKQDCALRNFQHLHRPTVAEAEEKERQHYCLERCTSKLSSENRELIRKYYIGDKNTKIANRRELAEEMGIERNALRIRAHRIRTELRHCVETCHAESEG